MMESMVDSVSDLLEFDKAHIWHPYTSMTRPLRTYAVRSAEGVRIELMNGTRLIDGMSSWWAAVHGYNHPVLNKAATDQIHEMSHVMFGGLTHQPAVDLAKELIAMTPEPLQHIFYADSGSVSVEVAIKMAFQYWQAMGRKNKNRLITVRSGYHGDTFMAMSVCDPVNGMHTMFQDVLIEHFFADPPGEGGLESSIESSLASMTGLIRDHHEQTAAVILEPVVQGAGGMRFYPPEYLSELKKLCESYDLLLILDEIATGFGRTGKMFASEHAGICPDIMCLGKALTGGYMTMAATLATSQVAHTICKGDAGVLMHGPTFMANPLACRVALASVRLLRSYNLEAMISGIEMRLKEGLLPLAEFEPVADVRVLGAIGVIEMKEPVDVESLQARFVENGVWIRPFGKLIYTMPPFIMTDQDLDALIQAIKKTIFKQYTS